MGSTQGRQYSRSTTAIRAWKIAGIAMCLAAAVALALSASGHLARAGADADATHAYRAAPLCSGQASRHCLVHEKARVTSRRTLYGQRYFTIKAGDRPPIEFHEPENS